MKVECIRSRSIRTDAQKSVEYSEKNTSRIKERKPYKTCYKLDYSCRFTAEKMA